MPLFQGSVRITDSIKRLNITQQKSQSPIQILICMGLWDFLSKGIFQTYSRPEII